MGLTLEERILWILEHRGLNQRELSIKAGLSSPSHVGTLLTRLRKNPDREADVGTLRALAKAGGVSYEWLSSGEGSPEPRSDLPLLRLDPGWPAARARAEEEADRLGEREGLAPYFDRAGECIVVAPRVDWQLVLGVARELRAVYLRDDSNKSGEIQRVPAPRRKTS